VRKWVIDCAKTHALGRWHRVEGAATVERIDVVP
jgi:hypothetical protein